MNYTSGDESDTPKPNFSTGFLLSPNWLQAVEKGQAGVPEDSWLGMP